MKFDLVLYGFLVYHQLENWGSNHLVIYFQAAAAQLVDICCKTMCQVRVEMFCRRISTQEERPESVCPNISYKRAAFLRIFYCSLCNKHPSNTFRHDRGMVVPTTIAGFLLLICGSTL